MSAVVRLRPADRNLALSVVRANPAENVFLNNRIQNAPANRIVDGELYATTTKNPALLYVGGNAVPVNLDVKNSNAVRAFADLLLAEQPPIGSLVGAADAVAALWNQLEGKWPLPARLIRTSQPYMVSEETYRAEVSRVRFATISDLADYFDAARQMFIGEVGLQPPSVMFQTRIAENLRSENSLGWFDENGKTLFKVDIGAMADGWVQIQGVWITPSLRGQGLAAELLSEAFTLIQRRFNVHLCLYVNSFNEPALRAYQRLGFRQVSSFQTVFF